MSKISSLNFQNSKFQNFKFQVKISKFQSLIILNFNFKTSKFQKIKCFPKIEYFFNQTFIDKDSIKKEQMKITHLKKQWDQKALII